ncbi:MAG TPA: hypothetical protein VFE30_09780 [Anaeromyxobacteraceae bacterium]|jgi:hypothetical protein|nr:hypothetical protein [Anaeromyxobacteraceae bacterium]
MASGQVLSYEAVLRTEAHQIQGSAPASRELSADTRLRLLVEGRAYALSLAYAPQFAVEDPPTTFRALHRGALTASLTSAPRWRLDGVATGSYGTDNLLVPALQLTPQQSYGPVQPVQPIPHSTVLPYVSGALSVAYTRQLDEASVVGATISGVIDGSPDSASSAQYPMQRSASLDLRYGWTGAADVAATALNGTFTRFGDDGTDLMATLLQDWRHLFTRHLTGWISAGPALVWSRFAGNGLSLAPILAAGSPQAGTTSTWLTAAGELGVRDKNLQPGLEGSLAVHVAPSLDRLTGLVYDRADLRSMLEWRSSPAWTWGAGLSYGVVLTGVQGGEQIATAELRTTWAEGATWEVVGGLRGLWQLQDPSSPQGVRLWTTYLGVTGRDRDRLR